MNEADLPSINLDELRLVPDWLREDAPSPSKQYANFDRPLETDRPDRRGPRPGGFGNRDRRDAPGSRPGGERRPERGRSGPPPRGGGPRDRGERPPVRQENYQPIVPAPLRVEFLPDDRCMASIIKQIRSTHMAYPLFSLARMFLQEPARHFLQLSLVPGASQPGASLHQLGDEGPVTLDRAALEAMAFDAVKDQFYKEEKVEKDPPKGNFTNVARERLSGTLLGPTNYHGYQPALRALYESRYSRRMSFDEYRRNVEVSSDPALVEKWKEEARTTTTISTVGGEPPTVFPSLAESRLHFRQHHLETLLHKGVSFRLHGSVARRLPEPAVMQAIREAHDRELRYPAQFVQLLRQGLQNAGLHIFKHRKRIVYVAATRPTPFVPASGAVTENVSLILETIAESPLCTRKFLAEKVLSKKRRQGSGESPSLPAASAASDVASAQTPVEGASHEGQLASIPEAPAPAEAASPSVGNTQAHLADQGIAAEAAPGAPIAPNEPPRMEDGLARAKTALAADLRFLIQAGHIIEFHNGTFDLPLVAKPKEPGTKNGNASSAAATPDDSATSIGSDPAEVQDVESVAPEMSEALSGPQAPAVAESAAHVADEAATASVDAAEPLGEVSLTPDKPDQEASAEDRPVDGGSSAMGRTSEEQA